MVLIKVVLPQPEGPMTGANLSLQVAQVNIRQNPLFLTVIVDTQPPNFQALFDLIACLIKHG
nr:hypothetical protein [Mobiluncus curtisii]